MNARASKADLSSYVDQSSKHKCFNCKTCVKRTLFFMSFMIFGVVYGLWLSWFLTTKNIVVSGFYFVFFGQVFQKHTIGHLDLNGIESLNKPRRLCKKGHIIYKMAQHHFKASIHEESRQKETSVKTVRIHKSCLSRQPWWTGQFWPHWHASMCAHALERARDFGCRG